MGIHGTSRLGCGPEPNLGFGSGPRSSHGKHVHVHPYATVALRTPCVARSENSRLRGSQTTLGPWRHVSLPKICTESKQAPASSYSDSVSDSVSHVLSPHPLRWALTRRHGGSGQASSSSARNDTRRTGGSSTRLLRSVGMASALANICEMEVTSTSSSEP